VVISLPHNVPYVRERSAINMLVHISPISACKNRTLTYIDDCLITLDICHTAFYYFVYLELLRDQQKRNSWMLYKI